MHQITVEYEGECRKCEASIAVGEQAVYEKHVGMFCIDCAPADSEEIRAYRQEAGDKRADKYDEWAAKRREKAERTIDHNQHYTSDIAFNTQPGHIPIRARIIKQDDRAFESLNTARRFEEKADSLRTVRVKGDAEKKRQAKREKLDTLLSKGSRVHDFCFGPGEIIGVYKKSYRIKFDSGGTYARDKSYVVPTRG